MISAIPLPGIDSTEMKTYPNWNLYGKTAPMSIHWWMNKHSVLHPQMEYYLTMKKKWSMDTCYAWTKAEKWKVSADDHILCDRASVKWPEHKSL